MNRIYQVTSRAECCDDVEMHANLNVAKEQLADGCITASLGSPPPSPLPYVFVVIMPMAYNVPNISSTVVFTGVK